MAHTDHTVRVVDGPRLRQLREDRVGAQTQLATLLGWSDHTHLSRIESGRARPSITTLHRIAQALECGLDDFTTREPVVAPADPQPAPGEATADAA